MTDVPGHTRGHHRPAGRARSDVSRYRRQFGEHPAGCSADLRWKDPGGTSLIMMYHLHATAAWSRFPDRTWPWMLKCATITRVRTPSRRFTGSTRACGSSSRDAQVTAANLTDIANAVEPYRERLPVVTQEIGDTWIYGVPSDPLKVARYREVARLRERMDRGPANCRRAMPRTCAFLSSFLLEVEHTWGTDTKTWLDFDHYTPRRSGAHARHSRSTKWCCPVGRKSAQDLMEAIATLPAAAARPKPPRACAAFSPPSRTPPDRGRTTPPSRSKPRISSSRSIPRPAPFRRLHSKKTGHDWASTESAAGLVFLPDALEARLRPLLCGLPEKPRGLGAEGFRQAQYRTFRRRSRTWTAGARRTAGGAATRRGTGLWPSSRSTMPSRRKPAGPHGRRRCIWNCCCPMPSRWSRFSFSWFGKAANRMPEALWLSFQPAASDPRGWLLDKSGSSISPFDVVPGGNRAMHAVLGGLRYQGPEGALAHRDAGRAGSCPGREAARPLFAGPARPGERVPFQPVQQRMGDQLYPVVWRRHAVPLPHPRLSLRDSRSVTERTIQLPYGNPSYCHPIGVPLV